jgi:translation initiation factor 3 subunit H
MKIIRHCQSSLSSYLTGQLLGMDNDGVLEVTYTFPIPAKVEDDETTGNYINFSL